MWIMNTLHTPNQIEQYFQIVLAHVDVQAQNSQWSFI